MIKIQKIQCWHGSYSHLSPFTGKSSCGTHTRSKPSPQSPTSGIISDSFFPPRTRYPTGRRAQKVLSAVDSSAPGQQGQRQEHHQATTPPHWRRQQSSRQHPSHGSSRSNSNPLPGHGRTFRAPRHQELRTVELRHRIGWGSQTDLRSVHVGRALLDAVSSVYRRLRGAAAGAGYHLGPSCHARARPMWPSCGPPSAARGMDEAGV